MRKQKTQLIEVALIHRNLYETQSDRARRVDENLSEHINHLQQNDCEGWDLLSVSPAGDAFPEGWFLTLWEMCDDEDDTEIPTAEEALKIVAGKPTPRPKLVVGDEIEAYGQIFRLMSFEKSLNKPSKLEFKTPIELMVPPVPNPGRSLGYFDGFDTIFGKR